MTSNSYEYKLSFIEDLEKVYPDISWEVLEPSNEIENAFGTGLMLKGIKNGKEKEFFIPEGDKKVMEWAKVIASYLV